MVHGELMGNWVLCFWIKTCHWTPPLYAASMQGTMQSMIPEMAATSSSGLRSSKMIRVFYTRKKQSSRGQPSRMLRWWLRRERVLRGPLIGEVFGREAPLEAFLLRQSMFCAWRGLLLRRSYPCSWLEPSRGLWGLVDASGC